MSLPQKRRNKQTDEFKAGGTDYVPPALCPRAAHLSACVSACVERPGWTGRRAFLRMRWVRPVIGNHPLLTWESA